MSGGFKVFGRSIRMETGAGMRVVDVTPELASVIRESGVSDGIATAFVIGSTAGITTVEYEPGLVKDLETAFEKIAPRDGNYGHDARWGDGNGHAHVRASMLGPSITLIVRTGAPALGTWQQVVFVDFDPPARKREIAVQVMGA